MIDPRHPDFSNTPGSPRRPSYRYASRGARHSVDVSMLAGQSEPTAPPAVTIVTPYFNAPDVFHETAKAVLSQSLQNFEWLIVDDGSTDRASLAMLDQYDRVDPRVRLIRHEVNKGLSAARNTGFAHARAGMVFMLDADDLIEPTTIEKCVWYLATHPEAAFVKGLTVGFAAQEYLWTKGFHDGRAFLNENLATATALVRKDVWKSCGGFDESIRHGMEDWDFWLRAASKGNWGATIHEYLDWYRRRAPAGQPGGGPWENLASSDRMSEFRDSLRANYASLYDGTFPTAHPKWQMPYESVAQDVPVSNPLAAGSSDTTDIGKRILLIAPWLTLGGADKFNLAMVRELSRRGWRVTIATTVPGDHSWMPEFTAITPDVFAMPHFLRMPDFPVFLRYLLESRAPDVVMVSNSELGYLTLPYLRAHHPEAAYVDLSHMEETGWKNGGHPRYAAGCQEMLELNIAVSQHLKTWMTSKGAAADRIEVCYVSTCEAPERFVRDDAVRARVRAEHGIPPAHPVILYAGRLVPQKQPRVFADVMRRLVKESQSDDGLRDDSPPSFTCLVAGDGPDMPWLRHAIAEHGLASHVKLLGAVPQERMHDLLSASDIFFLPSEWEGIALSIYEAMAMGLPIVGADVGGQRELVTPECGFLIQRATPDAEAEEYTHILRRLIAEPDAVARLGRAGSQRVLSGFVPHVLGDRLEAIVARAHQLRVQRPRGVVSREAGRELACRGVEYIRAFGLAEHLWHERDHLWRERDQLRFERDTAHAKLASAEDQHKLRLAAASQRPDPEHEAKHIIESNFRYRAADRVNHFLKSVGLQRAIKSITIRTLGSRRTKRPL